MRSAVRLSCLSEGQQRSDLQMSTQMHAAWLVEVGRVFRFGLVGILATAVFAITTLTAVELFHASPLMSGIIGQAASTIISYAGHRRFSFRVRGAHSTYF